MIASLFTSSYVLEIKEMKYLSFIFIFAFHHIAFADLIRVNCIHPNSYSFIVEVDTAKQTVIMNDRALMDNVIINKSVIRFDLPITDRNEGTHWSHQINRVTGVMIVKAEPNGILSYYQCEKIAANKF